MRLGRKLGRGTLLAFTTLVYLFMLGPVMVIVLLSFNPPEFGTFPMTGFTLKWFAVLFEDDAILTAIRTSLILGVLSAGIATVVGTAAAYALTVARLRGHEMIQTLLSLPVLVPHLILGVGLLLAFHVIGLNKSFPLLVVGHVAIVLPFVVLTVRHRLQAIPPNLEEAARTLGANRWQTFREITLPLALPAILAGMLFAFMMSFDEVTATLFWRPTDTETVPTYVLGMLQYSVNQQINALATLLIAISVGLPLLGVVLAGWLAKRPPGRRRLPTATAETDEPGSLGSSVLRTPEEVR